MITRAERILALLGAALLLAVLIASAFISPESKGHGTHEQLGMAPCPFLAATGIPCMTCGMTTSVSLASHGAPWRAIATQPVGALVALGAAVGFWACMHVAVFGSRLGRITAPLLTPRWLSIAAALWGASWIYKIITWSGS